MNKAFLLMRSLLAAALWMLIPAAYATQLSGSYTIDSSVAASTTNFKDFNSAVTYLTGPGVRTDGGPANSAPFGVSGAVVFTVAAGTYTEQVVLTGQVPGTSPLNTITFDGVDASTRILTGSYAAPT